MSHRFVRARERLLPWMLAVVLAGVVPGCSGGGGSLRYFFGTNGKGDCHRIVVDVDLAAAHATLATNFDGSVDCLLDTLLAQDGCQAAFTREAGHDNLHVVLDGCTLPPVASLFQCGFRDADLSLMKEVTTASCSCVSGPCDVAPPVCVGDEADPSACEICTNGKDDDGNGLVDCTDPNCRNAPPCASTTTSTSTSSTTSSSWFSTMTEPPSTTLPPSVSCSVRFAVPTAVTLAAIQWTTNYYLIGGRFAGSGGNVECKNLVPAALASFNDNDAEQVLTAGFVSLEGFTGPTALAKCTFLVQDGIQLVPADFRVNVVDATGLDSNLADPWPNVVVDDIDCRATTSTSVTDTMPPPTTVPQPTTTVPDITMPPPSKWNVTFHVDSADAPVGALQVAVDYSGADGDFVGSGSSVSCTNLASGALFAPNDKDAQHQLALGFVALTPFAVPVDVATCVFEAKGQTAPQPADFVTTIEDATDGDGNAIKVVVSSKVAAAP